MNVFIFLILAGLLVLEACQTLMPAPPPPQPEWQLPTDEKEEVAPERRQQPKEEAPKNMDERDHLKLLEGQLDWMKKRIKNEKVEWNDR